MKLAAAVLLAIAAAAPAAADDLSFRPFVMLSEQKFVATKTFEATFGQSTEPFWGGGLNITSDDRYYLEVSASRFKKTGTRAFVFNGTTFDVHIPQQVTITPLEFTAGYRFHRWQRILPTVGAGLGVYQYKQVSDFSTDAENVDTKHSGLIAEGGVEIRLQRWFGIVGDVHYTHIPGILGDAGLSKDLGEKDLGGLSARLKLVVGK